VKQRELLLALMVLLGMDCEELEKRAKVPRLKIELFLAGKEPMRRREFNRCVGAARAEVLRRRLVAEALLHGPEVASSLMTSSIHPELIAAAGHVPF